MQDWLETDLRSGINMYNIHVCKSAVAYCLQEVRLCDVLNEGPHTFPKGLHRSTARLNSALHIGRAGQAS